MLYPSLKVIGQLFSCIGTALKSSPNNLNTVYGDNINIMKTTFEFNFKFYQAFKQHGYTKIWKQRVAVNSKSFSLITCKLVIRKFLVNN